MADIRPDKRSDAVSSARLIGGFFGLELPSSCHGGFAKLWGITSGSAVGFTNARSAFAALIEALTPPKVWLPAYICPELAAAVPEAKLAFYPLSDDLNPDVETLAASTGAGDVVLAVNYFGRAPAPMFREFAQQLPHLCFVEDCAHSIDAGVPAWGNWRLFSPRKFIGVPDGGLLVATRSEFQPSLETVDAFDWRFEPALRRFEDEEENHNAIWHAANQRKEADVAVSRTRMSRLSRTLLELLDPELIIRRRRENYAVLQDRLGARGFLQEQAPLFVPFGFPIRVPSELRDAVVAGLAARGIFAARHWRRLPSPAGEFASEHCLAAELVTLPCDQRYDPVDMERVASTVENALS
jgi:dTDP-4-amino-4,6-dideoxygalactose transaminase